jgi:hypothetical protein
MVVREADYLRHRRTLEHVAQLRRVQAVVVQVFQAIRVLDADLDAAYDAWPASTHDDANLVDTRHLTTAFRWFFRTHFPHTGHMIASTGFIGL